MDKVTQQNAANAEESASASSRKTKTSSTHHLGTAQKTHELVTKHHGLSKSDHTFHHIAGSGKEDTTAKTAAKAIPLDDNENSDDFTEFND